MDGRCCVLGIATSAKRLDGGAEPEQQAERVQSDVTSRLTANESNSALVDTRAESTEHLDSPAHPVGEEAFSAEQSGQVEPVKDFFVTESPAAEVSKEFDARPFETAGLPAEQFFPSEDDRTSTNPIPFKDPALVEPPAVHVRPEPLLVDEEPRQSPEYGSHAEELPPAHSFFVPEADQVMAEESEAQGEEEPHAAPESLHSAAADVDERIPTGHPPNREALADIPFLVPPHGFRPDAPEPVASSDTVDAVVQKVLEKLEPQLHELLSQGVLRPLVESLLQGELAKKDKIASAQKPSKL